MRAQHCRSSTNENAPLCLTGVTNYGDGCGGAGKYSVFGRISHYRDWIDQHLGHQAKFCGSGPHAGLINGAGGGGPTSPPPPPSTSSAGVKLLRNKV